MTATNSNKLALKLYFEGEIDPTEAIAVFHDWIREGTLPGELMIDVADYSHVAKGPGVMLICDGVHYAIDFSDGRAGLRYARKRGAVGGLEDRLIEAMTSALEAAQLLRQRLGWVLDTRRLRVEIPDRLFAPNTFATFAEVEPRLRSFFADLYEGELEIAHETDETLPFTARVSATHAPAVEALLAGI